MKIVEGDKWMGARKKRGRGRLCTGGGRGGGGGEEGEIVKNLATLRYISHSKRRNESVF